MTGIANAKNMRLTALVYDMAMAGLAMYAALILRLGTFEGLDNFSLVGPFNGLDDNNLIFGAILPFVVAAGASLLILGTYRTSWRHASTTDLTNIVKAATLAVLIYMPICFVVNRLDLIPRTSIVLAWMVFLLLMAGSRIGYRLFREGHLFFERHPMAPGQVPILIVGGGVDAKILLLSLKITPPSTIPSACSTTAWTATFWAAFQFSGESPTSSGWSRNSGTRATGPASWSWSIERCPRRGSVRWSRAQTGWA